jgi:hypothetical protein
MTAPTWPAGVCSRHAAVTYERLAAAWLVDAAACSKKQKTKGARASPMASFDTSTQFLVRFWSHQSHFVVTPAVGHPRGHRGDGGHRTCRHQAHRAPWLPGEDGTQGGVTSMQLGGMGAKRGITTHGFQVRAHSFPPVIHGSAQCTPSADEGHMK